MHSLRMQITFRPKYDILTLTHFIVHIVILGAFIVLARRFEVLSVDLTTIEGLSAVQTAEGKPVIIFREDDINLIRTVRKRNTQLFDCLSVIKQQESNTFRYRASEGVLRDFRNDLAMVSFAVPPEMDNIAVYDRQGNGVALYPAQDIVTVLMEDGFRIGSTRYVPLVASAAMSRTNNYLYVNQVYADRLMRAITLDMIAMDADGNPCISGRSCNESDDAAFRNRSDAFISIPKAAAYAGNAYSDGSSVWEMLSAGGLPRGGEMDIDALLNAQSVVCVKETPVHMHLEQLPAVWASRRKDRQRAVLKPAQNAPAADEVTDLIAFFRACCANQADKLACCDRQQVCAQWAAQIDAYDAFASISLAEGLMLPSLPDTDAEAAVIIREYAVLCALALYVHHRRTQDCHTPADQWEPLSVMIDENGVPCVVTDDCIVPLKDALKDVLPKAGGVNAQVAADAPEGSTNDKQQPAWWELTSQLLRKPEKNRSEEWTMSAKTVSAKGQGKDGDAQKSLEICLRKAPYIYEAELRKGTEDDSVTALDDGVGFADDFFFNKLEQLMFGTVDAHAPVLNAVQIRLPWVKGLLVRFSFAQWLREKHPGGKQLYIRDLYGNLQPLFEADENNQATDQAQIHVMLTESMFKGHKWFRKAAGDAKAWATYWARIKAHGISLLIAGKNSPPADCSRLNYQFLSTLRLPVETLQKLTENQLQKLLEAGRDREAMRALIFDLNLETAKAANDENDPDSLKDDADGKAAAEIADGDAGSKADDAGDEKADDDADSIATEGELSADEIPLAADCSYVSDQYEALLHSTVLDMMRGRLRVKGDVRYIVPDLLQMIAQIDRFAVSEGKDSATNGKAACMEDAGAINQPALYAKGYHGCYYAPGRMVMPLDVPGRAMPQMRAPWIDKNGCHKDVLCLRNPHLTVGEDPILQPLEAEQRAEYDRWFSQLSGCVMIPNIAMQAINGADCDGDRANIICEEAVLQAAKAVTAGNNALLGSVLERADELTRHLAEKCTAPDGKITASQKEYLALVHAYIAALKKSSAIDPAALKASLISVPPLYAGSGAKGSLFSPESLANGKAAAREFRKAFIQSTEQRIGKMSLDILNIANSASRRNALYDGDAQTISARMAKADAECLINEFLAAMLLVNASLDTALEIDLAKTGMKRGTSLLHRKMQDKAVKKLMHLEESSAPFRTYRTLHKRSEAYLLRKPKAYQTDEPAFAAKLAGMMAGWDLLSRTDRAKPDTMTLNLLPELVYRHYTQHADAIRRCTVPLQAALCVPDEAPAALDACCAAMRRRVSDYRRDVKAHKEAEALASKLHKRYSYVAAWMLKTGCTLQQTMLALEDMRDMLCAPCWQNDNAVQTLADRLTDSDVPETNYYARWAWADRQTRAALLDALLTVNDAQLPCGGLIRQILLDNPNGMQLMKQMIRYLQAAALLRNRTKDSAADAAAELVVTPDALARQLKDIAAAHLQDTAEEARLYEHALIRLHQQGSLNDFLFVHLMGKEINKYLPDKARVVTRE